MICWEWSIQSKTTNLLYWTSNVSLCDISFQLTGRVVLVWSKWHNQIFFCTPSISFSMFLRLERQPHFTLSLCLYYFPCPKHFVASSLFPHQPGLGLQSQDPSFFSFPFMIPGIIEMRIRREIYWRCPKVFVFDGDTLSVPEKSSVICLDCQYGGSGQEKRSQTLLTILGCGR